MTDFEIFKRAIKRYGTFRQLINAVESTRKFQTELCDYYSYENNIQEVLEAIADISNILVCLRIIFDRHNEVDNIRIRKMNELEQELDRLDMLDKEADKC